MPVARHARGLRAVARQAGGCGHDRYFSYVNVVRLFCLEAF